MPFANLFFITGAVIFFTVVVLWLVSLALKNSSIIDIFWGIGFIIAAWLVFAFTPQGYLWRKQLLVALVTIWGLRLAIHIGIRNWGKPEDFRYARWRARARLQLAVDFLIPGISASRGVNVDPLCAAHRCADVWLPCHFDST